MQLKERDEGNTTHVQPNSILKLNATKMGISTDTATCTIFYTSSTSSFFTSASLVLPPIRREPQRFAISGVRDVIDVPAEPDYSAVCRHPSRFQPICYKSDCGEWKSETRVEAPLPLSVRPPFPSPFPSPCVRPFASTRARRSEFRRNEIRRRGRCPTPPILFITRSRNSGLWSVVGTVVYATQDISRCYYMKKEIAKAS